MRPYVSTSLTGTPLDYGPPSETYTQYIGGIFWRYIVICVKINKYPVAPYDDVTALQPTVLGYSNGLITLSWAQASFTGLTNKYNLYYSVFNPTVTLYALLRVHLLTRFADRLYRS